MEITTDNFIRYCKIDGFLKYFVKELMPDIIRHLEVDKKRTEAIELLKSMQKIIAEELIEKTENKQT